MKENGFRYIYDNYDDIIAVDDNNDKLHNNDCDGIVEIDLYFHLNEDCWIEMDRDGSTNGNLDYSNHYQDTNQKNNQNRYLPNPNRLHSGSEEKEFNDGIGFQMWYEFKEYKNNHNQEECTRNQKKILMKIMEFIPKSIPHTITGVIKNSIRV